MEPFLLRIQEAACALNVSKWTIYRWIEEGRLRATKIGRGSLRVFKDSVDGLIDGAKTGQASLDRGRAEAKAQVNATTKKKRRKKH